MVVCHYMACDKLCLELVQNRFLSYAIFFLKTTHPQHDYSLIRTTVFTPLLSSRRAEAGLYLITSLLNGSIDAPEIFFHQTPSVFARTLLETTVFSIRLITTRIMGKTTP